jgi:hypothetical protein
MTDKIDVSLPIDIPNPRQISFPARQRKDMLASLVIVLFILLIGLKLDVWTGDLKGDDAYFHVARVQYILDNFPHVNWYNQSFSGYIPMRFEPLFMYFPIALAQKATGLSIEMVFHFITFVSMATLGLSIYVLSRCLKIPRLLALGFALLVFSIPETWNWIIIGGAYLRIPALPFLFLSITLVYRHIKEIRSGSERFITYVITVLALALLAMLHPLIWQWGFLMLLTAYLIGIVQWRKKIYYVFKTFFPVVALAAWLYLPLLLAYNSVMSPITSGVSTHDTNLMHWRWLVSIPSPNSWSNSLGPVVLPVALFFLILAIGNLPALRKIAGNLRLELIFTAITGIFSIYFFAFGWLPMPKQLYLMASYDYVIWLGFSLVLFSIFACAILMNMSTFSWYRRHVALVVNASVVIIIIFGNISVIPFLHNYTTARNPLNPDSISYDIRKVLDTVRANSLEDYRIHNAQRLLQAWLPFADTDIDTTGGRSKNDAPHKYYNQWADSTVSYRLNLQDISSVYQDDRPQILRGMIGGEQNFYSSMFWLDWYGASGLILMPPFYPQWQTAQGYANRPQFFQESKAETRIGDLFFFRYPGSSPIAVSTSARVVAVPFQPGDAPSLYTDVLDVLSSLNLNSQWIIPVKLEDGDNLGNFDTAFVAYEDYEKYKESLNRFVEDGGHLVVAGNSGSVSRQVTVRVTAPELRFLVVASPLKAPEGSVILAETDGGAVVYRSQVGKGTVTTFRMTLTNLLESDSPVAGILLFEALAPGLEVSQIRADIGSSNVSYITEGTISGFSQASVAPGQTTAVSSWEASWNTERAKGEVSVRDNHASLTSELSGGDAHDQVNFSAYLTNRVVVTSDGFVRFDVLSDSEAQVDVGFLSISRDRYNAYPVRMSKGQWVRNLLPLSAFNFPVGSFDLSQEIIFAVNDNPAAGLRGDGDRVVLQIRNLEVASSGFTKSNGGSNLYYIADPGIQHNQVNWKLPFPRLLEADDNAVLTFALWHDGKPTSGIGIALERQGVAGYLYYDLPEKTWDGWREYTIPLSYFRWKEGEQIESFDSLSICFNEDPPYQSEQTVRHFQVRDVQVATLGIAPGFIQLDGEWQQANKFELTLKDNRRILWKESFMPTWKIRDEHGHRVDHYFAGPGMIYLVAPDDAQTIIFEMPFPKDQIIGMIISAFSLIAFISYILLRGFFRGKGRH